ncbi:unnamed protein product [Meloidogyne enterolobii]|uniref:Uncharacterized protein n=1 Tax=Meloidogyne enterolobii TaxID=390850 RepID=A0ACB1AYH0_MELEN
MLTNLILVDNTSSRERKSSNDTMNKFKQALKGVPPETTVELENIKTNIDPLWKDIKEKHNRIIRFYKNAKEATINRCVKIKNFAWEINKYKQEKERESSSTDLFVPITTPEVEKMNKAFNQIKLKPAIIYLIYLYEQKRNKKDLKKYEDKINKLRGLAGNIQNFNLQFYEQQNLQALQKYIHINWSIKVVEEEKYKSYHFYNELLKIKFYFHWPTFTFKQSIHDPSYKPTPLGSGAQSFAESSRPSTSMQRSGRDSGHIIATPEEEEEGDDEEDEGEEEYDEEEDEEEDQPETAATAFRQDEGHGEIQPEGHQLGWQGGYPPQWTGQNIPWNHPYDASQFYAPQWTGQFDDHGRPIYYAYPGESSHQLGWQGHDPSHQLGWQGMESYTLKQDEQI